MNKKLFTLLTLPALLLVSCGKTPSPDDGGDDETVIPDAPDNPEDGNKYDAWLNSWSKGGHMYFHYNRGKDADDYDNYALWVWPFYPDSLEGTLWGYSGKTKVSDTLTLKPMSTKFMSRQEIGLSGEGDYKDNYGIIFDVDLTNTSLVGGKTGVPVTFDGSTEIGFLFPRIDSMDGSKNWVSDGGVENYITDYTEESNWRVVKDGKAIHIFLSTGSLDQYKYFAGDGTPQPMINPVDTDETGNYRSKLDNDIAEVTGAIPTSESFKDLGVGYQIFVASFRDSNGDGVGDINGIRESLKYLKDLGVDCLWLTPVQKSGSYHGYDTIDYLDIDKRFGTMEDYEHLISEAHAMGIKVLMDLVLNHTSKSNSWFTKSKWDVVGGESTPAVASNFRWRDVYTWKYKTDKIKKAVLKKSGNKYVVDRYDTITVEQDALSANPSWFKDGESNYYYYGKFGSGMPEINFENKAVRQLIIDVAKFWLAKNVDGFRLDAVKHIYMNDEAVDPETLNPVGTVITDVGVKRSYDEERGQYISKEYDYSSNISKNVNWWKEFSKKLKESYANCFLVGENFDGWGARIAPYYQALDSQFDFSNFYHVPAWIYNTDGGASTYNYDATGGGQSGETYDYFATSESYKLGDDGPTVQGGCRPDFINGAFTSNHDVMRLINQANGLGNKDDTVANDNVLYGDEWANGKAKFQAAVTILNPGLSWIYYGDELGMTSNTYQHIDMYGSENNMDIWYRQPFLWKDKSVRANYKSGQYKFELDEHNRHLVNNGEGIDYKVSKDKDGNVISIADPTSMNDMWKYFKVLTTIKAEYPKGAKIQFEYSSENVLRAVVYDESYNAKLVVFMNNGRNDNDYIMMVDSGFSPIEGGASTGVDFTNGGNIGKTKFGVAAFKKA